MLLLLLPGRVRYYYLLLLGERGATVLYIAALLNIIQLMFNIYYPFVAHRHNCVEFFCTFVPSKVGEQVVLRLCTIIQTERG